MSLRHTSRRRVRGQPCRRRTISRERGKVPTDLPHDTQIGALPKFLARLIDGRYIVGPTPEEVAVRNRGCVDLVEQLQKTVLQFAAQNP